MEKQISRVIRPTARKKRLMGFLVVVMASLILGLVLQGCETQRETDPAIVEEVSEEETRGEVVDWCDSAGDLYESLPPLGDEAAEGITVEICIPGGEGYTIETYDGDLEDLESTKDLERPFDIYSFLTYFKIKNGDEVITSFEPAMLMRITYTRAAWNAILGRDYDVPRVVYLPWEGDGWGEEWVEFEVIDYFPPGTEGNPEGTGFLIITIDELPDPLIGDC